MQIHRHNHTSVCTWVALTSVKFVLTLSFDSCKGIGGGFAMWELRAISHSAAIFLSHVKCGTQRKKTRLVCVCSSSFFALALSQEYSTGCGYLFCNFTVAITENGNCGICPCPAGVSACASCLCLCLSVTVPVRALGLL